LGTATVNVTVNSLSSVSLSDVNLCNSPVSIGTSPVAGNTYSWSPVTGLSDAFIANPTSSTVATTTYTLTITDANGCQADFDQTVNVLAPSIEAGNDLTICEGDKVTIGALPSEAGAIYSWTPTTGLTDPTSAQTTAEPTVTTTYILTASIGGCTSTDSLTITVTPAPLGVEDLEPFAIICENDCQTIGIAAFGDYQYEWLPASVVSSPNSSMTEICPSENTALSLRVTDPNSGCSVTQDIDVYITTGGDCPVICNVSLTAISSNPTTCSGTDGSISLTLTNVPDGTYTIDYMDTIPSTQTFTNVSVSSGTATISGLSEGTYNDLTITVNGCTSTEDVDIVLTEPIAPVLTIDGATCDAGGPTYTIDFTSDGTVTSTAGTVSGNQVIDIPAGTDVTITATLNGCTTEETVVSPDCGPNCPPTRCARVTLRKTQ
jgi:hypothetical protein